MKLQEIINLRQFEKQSRIESLINFKEGKLIPRLFIVDYLYKEEMDKIILYQSENGFEKFAAMIAVETYLTGCRFLEIKAMAEKVIGYDDARNENPEFKWLENYAITDSMADFINTIKMNIPFSREEYEYLLSSICFKSGLNRKIKVIEAVGTDVFERELPIYSIVGDQLFLNTFEAELKDEEEDLL